MSHFIYETESCEAELDLSHIYYALSKAGYKASLLEQRAISTPKVISAGEPDKDQYFGHRLFFWRRWFNQHEK